MKIILTENVEYTGQYGDIITVNPGFAQNYLFPLEKAILATKKNIKIFNKEKLHRKKINIKTLPKIDLEQINNLSILIPVSVYEDKKFHGSINAAKIYKIINNLGFKINKKYIKNDIIIKQTGDYKIELKLSKNLNIMVYLMVVKNN